MSTIHIARRSRPRNQFMFGNYPSVGGGGGDQQFLSFGLSLTDAGAGAVNTTAFAAGDGTPTFTRATTAWTKLSTGLWASVASGTARSSYLGADTTVSAYGGYLAEGARTNLCLQARDLSTTWTALNATLVKDQVGIDGVGNSASSMTATLGNGSALQTITEAATLSALSLFIKRITGTGTVTIQQGASTSEISGSLNSSTYTRVELDATVLNPAIGITLGTNGDKIAVDMVQFENGGFASTPIPTTTVAVTRNADVLSFTGSGNYNKAQGSFYAEYVPNETGAINTNRELYSTTSLTNELYIVLGTQHLVSTMNALDSATETITLTAGTLYKFGQAWNSSSDNVFSNGVAGTAGSGSPLTGSPTTLYVGNSASNIAQIYGTIRNVCIYPTALSAAQLQAMTT